MKSITIKYFLVAWRQMYVDRINNENRMRLYLINLIKSN